MIWKFINYAWCPGGKEVRGWFEDSILWSFCLLIRQGCLVCGSCSSGHPVTEQEQNRIKRFERELGINFTQVSLSGGKVIHKA
jgi:heterodisulfide reductase subunit C